MDSRRISKSCKHCGQAFSLPRCRDHRDHFCSSACAKAFRVARDAARVKACTQCGVEFVHRPNRGAGLYCSVACAGKSRIGKPHPCPRVPMSEEERRAKNHAYYLANKAHIKARNDGYRRADPEHERERQRQYRAANPHKTREWYQNRRCRQRGRLKRGTVAALFDAQRGKCAICAAKLNGYHVDHIMPLALGGAHEKANLQLLCGPCNVRKWAKDPIRHMQELGRLL